MYQIELDKESIWNVVDALFVQFIRTRREKKWLKKNDRMIQKEFF